MGISVTTCRKARSADRSLSDLGLTVPNLTLLYAEHRGGRRLRELIVADQPELSADDVLITGGAATALFIVSTSLLGASDHLVVVRPNYATNLETPRAIGCAISFIDLGFEAGFRLDFDALAAAITPRTRLVSVTCPHNPSGVMFTAEELQRLVALTEANGCYLLVDETYRDLSFDGPLPQAAALGRHVISVSSLSKAYGIPGIRIGWLITRDPKLQETVSRRERADQHLRQRDRRMDCRAGARRTRPGSSSPHWSRCASVASSSVEWIAQEPLLEWVPPQGGVVCFPAHESGAARGHCGLLSTPARVPWNLCGSGPLV